jgi:predicted PhzF superfamily epimerase YddE/YHI9
MKLNIATVDAFTNQAFSGNPAAVCLLEENLTNEQMQLIALEMNLSETAFVTRTSEPGNFGLRWFTPTLEIDLCGHATLASAFWMIHSGWVKSNDPIRFQTKSGELRVKGEGNWIEMDFPLIPTTSKKHPFFETEIFGQKILHASHLRRNWIFELENYQAIEALIPDFGLIAANSEEGIIITSSGNGTFDIYSRFFGPNVGVPEDPVTGFAHCALMDYWFKRKGVFQLKAFQASKRGGVLYLEKREERVILRGQAVKILTGHIEF